MSLTRPALLLLVALLAAPLAAEAVVLTQTGAVLTVEYDEPTTNVDDTPLTDLAGTRVTYTVEGTAESVAGPLIPASAPAGGGHITTTITVPVGPNEDKLVTVTATAEDLVGNVSVPSDPVSKRIDRRPPKKIQ